MMNDFTINFNEGFRSINIKNTPIYIYLNGREYEMREVEALFLSGKVQRVLENDENANLIGIEIKKEDVFGEYQIEEEEFEDILSKSFERILNTVRNIFTNNLINNQEREMSMEELCCTNAILDMLESKSLRIKVSKYNDIEEIEKLGKEKAIEILNTVGSEKSIEYVGKHLMEVEIGKISPGRLEEVLRSEEVRVRGEGDILRVVEESIGVYGWGAGFLLGCVEASLLSGADRNRYVELISQYIHNTEEKDKELRQYRRYNSGERKLKGNVEIEGEIVESLLRCVGKNGEEGLKVNDLQSIDIRDRIVEAEERIGVSESLTQCDILKQPKLKNLNEYFRERITMSAKTSYNKNYRPENVLIPGDDQYYWSAQDKNSRDQWIQFDFPENIYVRKLDIRPYGGDYNPRRLNIKAVNGANEDLIEVAEFPNENQKAYAIETTKDVWAKSIRIEMDGENYWSDKEKYTLVLNGVVIYGLIF